MDWQWWVFIVVVGLILAIAISPSILSLGLKDHYRNRFFKLYGFYPEGQDQEKVDERLSYFARMVEIAYLVKVEAEKQVIQGDFRDLPRLGKEYVRTHNLLWLAQKSALRYGFKVK